MSSLDKVLAAAGAAPEAPDPDADLLLAVQLAARELAVLLASDDEDDGKGDDGDDGDGGHADHATYKALIKRKVPPDRASAMCARSDKKVKATALAQSLEVMLSGRPGVDIGLVTLTPASETAARRRKAAADVNSLPGSGSQSDSDGEKVAAAMLELAKHDAGDGGVAMNHGPFTGTHTHSHWVSTTHAHPHQHAGDNRHDGGPLHRPGSKPGGRQDDRW